MKTINYEKKEMIPLTNEEKEAYENQKNCYICEKDFVLMKRIKKSEIVVITQENIEELLIVYATYATKYQKRFQ